MGLIDHLSEAAATIIIVYATYLLGNAIYNVTFHPLAKFPGKKIDGAFQFPWHWHQMRGNSASYIKSLHDEYGEVVRISPFRLSFNTSQAWRGKKSEYYYVRNHTNSYKRYQWT